MKRILFVGLLVLLVAGGYLVRGVLFHADDQTQSARLPPAQLVVADVAVRQAMPILLSTFGNVQPIATVMVKSRMDGEIAGVNFEEGQEVKEGDLLFALDDQAVRAQLEQAKANLERDRAQLARNQLELKRQTGLAGRGVAPEQKLQDVQTSVAVSEAAVRASAAALENAKVNLSYTMIRAPIGGRTGAIALRRGNIVKAVDTTPSVTPLVTITQLTPIFVGMTIPERYLADLRAAMAAAPVRVEVTVPGQKNGPAVGTVSFLENQVDTPTGTIALKAKFANEAKQLWPGQFVNATVTLGIQPDAVVVPNTAIEIGPNGTYVFVIGPDSAVELRLVTVNRSVNGKTVVAQGLTPGDRVVVDGQSRLSNGTRVTAQAETPDKSNPVPVAERAP